MDVGGNGRDRLIFIDVDQMFDDFGLVAGPAYRVNFIPHERLAYLVLARSWSLLLVLAFEPESGGFEDRVGS